MGPLTKESPESARVTGSSVHLNPSTSQGMHAASIDAFGIEIPVRLQGGHTGAGAHGATETYQEETCTLIVFPQGAVLRSSTSLSPGQNLVLKNQKTNQEVPCRVANLRSYSTGYVEIEFTRPAPGFWGIIFPSEASKSPKQAATPSPAPAVTPVHKALTSLPRPAFSKDMAARTFSAKASKPERPPAAPPAPAAVPPKIKEQPVEPETTALAARPLVKEQPVSLPTSFTPHPTQASSFSAPSSYDQETLPVVDLVAIKPPVGKASARSDRAAGTAALPGSLGSLEEKEHWSTLSYGRFSSFQVLDAKDDTRDDFSLGAPSPVRERDPRRILILIGAATLVLALGTGAFFLRRHTSKTAVTAASFSPATTPVLEQPNPAVKQQNTAQQQAAASPSAESPETPLPPPPSVKPGSQPGKQTPAETTEVVVSQPKNKAPAAAEPAQKTFFKLAPHAAAPQRASVSRETPVPPALGDEAAASPAGLGISNGIMPGALQSDAAVLPPPPEKTPERIGGEVKLPQLLHMVPPSYPPAAKQTNLQGEVTIQASIDTTGKVADAKVISGPMLLRQAAMDAVRRWKYEPATLDGKPVPMQVVVKVRFRLN